MSRFGHTKTRKGIFMIGADNAGAEVGMGQQRLRDVRQECVAADKHVRRFRAMRC
jgi:hypothetical protein